MFFSVVFFFERTRPAASMKPPCLIYLSTSNEARPRDRSDRGRFLPIGEKSLFLIPDCESCTRPISTNPGSIEEACEYGLTRGTCFVARRLGGRGRRAAVDFVVCFWVRRDLFVFFRYFFLRTHTACCKYEAALPHLPIY